jgi:geranylgeranyl pyrophosphate synthase
LVEKPLTAIDFLSPVQDFIPYVEARMREQSNGHHPDLQAALDHLLDSGGKRVRPSVALLVGGMLGADQQRSITLAAAVELLHTATLVHDDLIDGALLRRGIPTLNAKWSPAATILTGDFIFARAAKLAAETGSVEIMNLFAKTLSVVVNGEITQLFSSKGLASRSDYFERIYAKTASMFELATTAPIYLCDGCEYAYDTLHRFGHEIGMAFQIVDDILDFSGAQAEMGKPVANDLRQGLVTLPALCYLEQNPDDPMMKKLLSGEIHDDQTIDELIQVICNSGAIQKAMQEARPFVERALEALAELPVGPERTALEGLAGYVIEREV